MNDNEALQLAEEIANRYSDEKTTNEKAQRLIKLLPLLTTAEIDRVVDKLEYLAHNKNLWKKQIAGHVIEITLIRRLFLTTLFLLALSTYTNSWQY